MKIYWDRIIGDPSLLEGYQETINKIVFGNYKAADLDLKKLSGHRVYSVRVNRRDRLLFTTIHVQGKAYLLLLEVVPEHDYQKSRFLKSGVLRNYLEKNAKGLTEEIINFEEGFIDCAEEEIKLEGSAEDPGQLQYAQVEFYNKTFIEFNVRQQEVKRAPLPLLVSGPPGSGKTCGAFAILTQAALQQNQENGASFLYITESADLVKVIQEMWEEFAAYYGVANNKVQCKTYRQMLHELDPVTKEKQFVGEEHFFTWFTTYVAKRKKICKTTQKGARSKNSEEIKILDEFVKQQEQVYQEFRILGAYSNPMEYMKLGEKQSLFHSPRRKQWLLEAYTSYTKELDSSKFLNPAFYFFESKSNYSLVVADEAQDWSFLQLMLISNLAQDCAFLMDTHQSLRDKISKRPFLFDLYEKRRKKLTHVELSTTYRCPSNVIPLVNEVIDIKNVLTGGIADKNEFVEIADSQNTDSVGEIRWRDRFSDNELAELIKAASTPAVAVITHERFKKEASALFKTPLVFSSDKIKGLEYPITIIYKPLEHELFIEANTILTQNIKSLGKTIHRAKEGIGNVKFGPLFNQLFVMLTRTQDMTVIYQENHRGLETLINRLYLKVIPNSSNQPLAYEMATTMNWQDEAKKQYQNGNIEQAKQIFIEKLGKQEADFVSFFSPKPQVTVISQEKQRSDQVTQKEQQAKLTKPDVIVKKALLTKEKKLTKEQYVEGLLKNCTANNLRKLFKDPNATKYLFEIVLPGKKCLFLELASSEHSHDLLIDVLNQNSAFCELITAKHLESIYAGTAEKPLLLSLIPYKKIPALLYVLVSSNRMLAHKLSAQVLCQLVPSSKNHPGCTDINAVYLLSRSELGTQILGYLLIENPALVTQSFAEALCHMANTPDDVATTAFANLAVDEKGIKLITYLLIKYPWMISHITSETLYHQITLEGPGLENSSLFSILCLMGEEGIEILTLLLENNECLRGEAFSSAANRVMSVHHIKAYSGLYSLLMVKNGVKLFHKLLNLPSSPGPTLSVDALSQPFIVKPGIVSPEANATSLYLLVQSKEGEEALIKLLNQNPGLMDAVVTTMLCKPLNIIKHKGEEISVLYYLSFWQRFDLLSIIFQRRDLATDEFATALCRVTKDGSSSYAFYWLTASVSGQLLLRQLFCNNPKLIKLLKPEMLTITVNKQEQALTNLLNTFTGQYIIKLFLEVHRSDSISERLLEANPPPETLENSETNRIGWQFFVPADKDQPDPQVQDRPATNC
ncbi:hypothetical protein [Legionella brunensis]|uniref:DNA 3'-5' helicase II n=1 Tax=Legionella brunensis TaxID=29422 RepID=A0A0W0SQ31_9GAMM|nr:hypothetical protein [Legionella brunensis]KTC85109.1 hypothetical protein Lbru_0905 [Legionella brunensis]